MEDDEDAACLAVHNRWLFQRYDVEWFVIVRPLSLSCSGSLLTAISSTFVALRLRLSRL